jgi:hypothetical protein
MECKMQLSSKLPHESATTIKQLVNQVPFKLSKVYIKEKVTYVFYGVKVWEVMQHLLMGGKRILNEALSQIFKLKVAKGSQSSQKQGCK